MLFWRRLVDAFYRPRPVAGPGRKLTITGDEVKFDLASGRTISMGRRVMVHDPTGTILPRHALFFGPGSRTRRSAAMSSWQSAYFGSDYDAKIYQVRDFEDARAKTGWRSVGDVKMIWYRRSGSESGGHPGPFYHPFKPPAGGLALEKHGSFYRVISPDMHISWRGIVRP